MAEQSKKKVAVVTGASRGIGRAIALELASRGAAVVINYNGSEERAREVQKEIEEKGGEAEIRQWNVADYKACESAVKDIVKTHGSIDILVNNAGITKDGLLMGMSDARKATAFAMSSGLPKCPSGICAADAFFTSSDNTAVISVSINPGATALTVTPRDASSLAALLVIPMIPALDAA